jgi:hypothetical protein
MRHSQSGYSPRDLKTRMSTTGIPEVCAYVRGDDRRKEIQKWLGEYVKCPDGRIYVPNMENTTNIRS